MGGRRWLAGSLLRSLAGLTIAAALLAGPGASALADGPPQSNQFVLTRAESIRLVSWAGDLRACLSKGPVGAGTLTVLRTRVEIRLNRASSTKLVVHGSLPCIERLGGPPLQSSVQGFADRIVLYLPKRCLLDPKVPLGKRGSRA